MTEGLKKVDRMQDSYGRSIDYMRVSITDRCNLRCRYCMPAGIEQVSHEEILTYEQIELICQGAARAGIRKIKVTGGEALVRRGCTEFIGRLKRIPGIDQVTLTTNGILLKQYLPELLKNGLDAVNISLDTLHRDTYEKITGKDALDQVRDSIILAVKSGLQIKINTVLQPGINEDEWLALSELAKNDPIDIRFIEMMPIGYGKEFEPISNKELQQKFLQQFPNIEIDSKIHGNGPAVYHHIPGYMGSIGFISPIHGKFCHSCNRIRLTAMGKLKPCLCYGESIDLKEVLCQNQWGKKQMSDEIERAIYKAISMKPKSHCFEDRDEVTEEKQMVSIGG